jgi:hypothetical protein
MVCGKTRVAEAVQHVPEHGGKPGAVQPIATEPSVGYKGGVGVVIHLSKTREKQINISSTEKRQQTKTLNKPRRQQNINSDSIFNRRRSRKTLLTETGTESGKVHNMKVIENFETFPERTNTPSSN